MRRAFASSEFGLGMANWSVVVVGNLETLRFVLETGSALGFGDVANEACPVTNAGFLGFLDGLRADWETMAPEAKTAWMRCLYFAWSATSPLHQSSYVGNLGAVKLLLEKGARVDTQDHWLQMTPLMLAVHNGHEQIASSLVEAGAKLTPTDKRGRTAADVARQAGYLDLSERLMLS